MPQQLQPRSRFQVDVDALYIVDNGACYCGQHLGATASMTGRDLSGQRIHKVTPADVREARAMDFTLRCEVCK